MHRFRELDFHLMVVFNSLCHTGSVTRTAEHLQQTQGAVSHSLKKLRALFGDELFIRSKRGLMPTQRGEELAGPVAALLMQGEQLLLTHSDFNPATSSRAINICMNDVGEVAIVPTLLKQVDQNAPNCAVNILPFDMSTAEQSLENGHVDLLISGYELAGSDIMRQKLYNHRIAVLVGPDSRLPDRISLQEFCELDHIAVRAMHNSPVPLDTFLELRGLKRRVVATTKHGVVLPYWLLSDARLVATLPSFLAAICVARGGFRTLEVDDWLPSFDVFQYWHRRYDNDRFNIWLRRTLRLAVGQHDMSAEQ